MSYHNGSLGMMPAPIPTSAYTQSVDPYAMRSAPPGGVYGPYGWGPGTFVGMPMSYTHHAGYYSVPVHPGTYDRLSGLGAVLAVL